MYSGLNAECFLRISQSAAAGHGRCSLVRFTGEPVLSLVARGDESVVWSVAVSLGL